MTLLAECELRELIGRLDDTGRDYEDDELDGVLGEATWFLRSLLPLSGDVAMNDSPTCVVSFDDSEVCRMTTWNASGKPDLARGIKLARYAYESRKKRPPPAIVAVHFEADGVALLPYTDDEIAKVCSKGATRASE